ncbi:MAG TPA: hypothetical protein DCS93_09055 [Microscillaceae bacterium]|nr:hypothetical protein [Microscillaceae bacterium]
MKKAKFANFKKLSYNEMKHVTGGNTTCWDKMEIWDNGSGNLQFHFSQCCGDYNSCDTCFYTGPGCTVGLLAIEIAPE